MEMCGPSDAGTTEPQSGFALQAAARNADSQQIANSDFGNKF
jgi:hypothetical protein